MTKVVKVCYKPTITSQQKSMSTIIISDTHLTSRFNAKKFKYLKKILSQTDKVIINGDFWDGYLVSFDKFIKSKWQKLFPLLKSKKTIYIYGNHDSRKLTNQKISFFTKDQHDSLDIKVGNKDLHIQHGHAIAPEIDDLFPWIFRRKPIVYLSEINERLKTRLRGEKFLAKYQSVNDKIKDWYFKSLPRNKILVCGHSHFAELDLDNNFINSGLIRHGYARYLKIKGDNIELIQERY